MKVHQYLVALVIVTSVLILTFQNCGKISLQPTSTAKVSKIYQKDFGNVCAPDSVDVPMPQKIVVILDMSSSNPTMFNYNPGFSYLGGRNLWFLGQSAQQKANTFGGGVPFPTPTDLNGVRFTSMINYINSCQSSASKYAVIGFSSMIIADTTQQGCQSPFTSPSAAIQSIDGLKNLQASEIASTSPSGIASFSNPFNMQETSYQSAFSCMAQRITNDIDPSSVQRNYKVIFLTDGKPTDKDGANPMANSRYISQLQTIQNTLSSHGFSMSFQAVYYGPQDQYSANPVDLNLAQPRLDAMSIAVNGATSGGSPVYPTIQIPPSSSGLTGGELQNAFCSLEDASIPVNYSIDHAQVYSLTSRQIGNQLYADRDMDGINDDWERQNTSFGFDFENSRTRARVLDALCYMDFTACQSFTSGSPSCDPTRKIGFGFNECDQVFMNHKILKVASNPGLKIFDGIDYDSDGVLDYIELIKGTNMLVNDMNENPGGDGISNATKLAQGLDPTSFLSQETIQKYQHNISISTQTTCSSGEGVGLKAGNLSFVDIGAYHDSFGIFPDHGQDENVYVIIYYAKPAAYDTRFHIFRQYMFLKKDGSFYLDSTGPSLIGTTIQGVM